MAGSRPEKESEVVVRPSRCRETISVTVNLPGGCRISPGALGDRLEELVLEGRFSDLCLDCPLGKPGR